MFPVILFQKLDGKTKKTNMTSATGKMRRYFMYAPFYILVVAAVALVLLAIVGNSGWSEAGIPALLAAVLTAYLAWEVRREIDAQGLLAFASPAVLATFLTFFISFSLPILTSFSDDFLFNTTIRWIGTSDIMGWISYAMALACVSGVAYWQGYRLPFAKSIAAGARSGGWTRLIRPELNLRMPLVLVLYAVSIGAKLVQIRLGVFGYAADTVSLIENAPYRGILDAFSSGGRLALFLIALHVFRPDVRRGIGWLVVLAALTILEVLFGLLSGFKGQTVFPIVYVGFAYFLAKGRVSFVSVALALVVLFAAYAIVEPFRRLRGTDENFVGTSLTSITNTIVAGAFDADDRDYQANNGVLGTVGHRAELVSMTAAALRYRDVNEDLGDDAPAFLANLAFSPIYALIPRIIWKNKPLADFGMWFDMYVLNGGDLLRNNSVGMGPISFFYFAGGIFMVIVGFMSLGLLHRVLFETLPALGVGGGLMYLAILQNMVVINSEVGAWFAGLIQTLVVSYLAQAIFLKPGVEARHVDLRSPAAELPR